MPYRGRARARGIGTLNQRSWTTQKYQDGEQFDNGKLIISLDDGWQSWYGDLYTMLKAKGVKTTLYVNLSSIVAEGAEFLTPAQYNEMAADGQDFQCHGYAGLMMAQSTDEQVIGEMVNQNNECVARGLSLYDHHAYSGGAMNNHAISLIQDYRKTARFVAKYFDNDVFTNRKTAKYALPCATINLVANSINMLKYAKKNKLAYHVWGHQLGEGHTALSVLEDWIDAAIAEGLDIITVKQLYPMMFYIDLRIEWVTNNILLTFVNEAPSICQFSIERSSDGITFTEIAQVAKGNKTYLDEDVVNTNNYYYRVRAFSGSKYLPYSRVAKTLQLTSSMTLTASGTGAGVATLGILVAEEGCALNISGNGKFYTNLAGTEGETASIVFDNLSAAGHPGQLRTIYIKVTSGTSTITVTNNSIASISEWTSPTNAPSLAFDITKWIYLNYVSILGKNTVSGNIKGLIDVGYFRVEGTNTIVYENVTNLKKLHYLYIGAATVMTSANVNQILADIRANKDELKPPSNNIDILRELYLVGAATSQPPTGQGVIDLAYLRTYRSPSNDALYSLWTINTAVQLGEELVPNGGFDDTTGWTIEPGWAISDGKAHYDNVATKYMTCTLNAPIEAGKKYRIAFAKTAVTPNKGVLEFYKAGATIFTTGWTLFGQRPDGNVVYYNVTAGLDVTVMRVYGLANAIYSAYNIDNLSIKEEIQP